MPQLSSEYARIYDNLLRAVGACAKPIPTTLTALWPMRGNHFDGDLYVIGRCTNGWYDTWEKATAADAAQRRNRTAVHTDEADCSSYTANNYSDEEQPMLDQLRISAHTYNVIKESELGHKTPGHVEVTVEVLQYDQKLGEADWTTVLRTEGDPDQVRALAAQFEQVAAELKRTAKQAERQRETCRIVADTQGAQPSGRSPWDPE